jgi:hypothetical protein
MSENIDYKSLYELVLMEKTILVEQNIKLTKELDKYKIRCGKKSSYADDIELIMEEVKKNLKK